MRCRWLFSWGVLVGAAGAMNVACADTEVLAPRQRPVRAAEGGAAGEGGLASEAGNAGEAGDPSSAGAASGAGGMLGGGAGAGGDASAAGAPEPEPVLRVRELSVLQTVEVPLIVDATPLPSDQRNAPLVAGKRALLRAQVDLAAGFAERPLLGVLEIERNARVQAFVSERSFSHSSQADELETSFVFDVASREFAPGSRYRLRIRERETTAPLVSLPETGFLELGAQPLRPFELVLVPIAVKGFVPRLSEADLAALQARFTTLYPSPAVEISLDVGFAIEYPFNADGDGWEQALDDLLDHRQAAKPARNVFYYGLLAPAASYDSYCSSSCILGLSNVGSAASAYERGSIGVAVFPDGSGAQDAWDTLLHELGHALGRRHADCGNPDYPDANYPYEGAGMGGVYGYDFSLMQLIEPKPYRDVMSYCTPMWISDYTYSGIFERLQAIDGEALRVQSLAPAETLRVARVDRHGRVSWRGERRERASAVDAQSFDLLDAAGRRVARAAGRVSRLDHLPAASVWFPRVSLGFPGATAVDLSPLGGGVLPL